MAWGSVDKTVTLVVDGQPRQVHTVAADVAAILKESGYVPGPHDIVAPGLGQSVGNGQKVVLKRGRLLHLNVDGARQDLWVTAPTVADALSELGYGASNFSSVSRDKRLPLVPTTIDLRSPKTVTIVLDGQPKTIHTTALTVRAVLAEAKIVVAPNQQVSVDLASPPTEGQQILVQTVTHGTTTTVEAVAFTTTSTPDPTMPKGTTQVVTKGKNGTAQVTWDVVYVNGVAVGKTALATKPLTTPVNQMQKVGSGDQAAIAAALAQATPGSNRDIGRQLAAARGWGDDQFACLVKLWNKESGWQVNDRGPGGAYGIPQAVPGDKMGAVASDWRTNPATQITWGLNYIGGRYKTPCGAWGHSQSTGWY